MNHFLGGHCALKRLETPSVYDIRSDELYELDEEAFGFIRGCASKGGCDESSADKEFFNYCVAEELLVGEDPGVRRPPLNDSPSPSLRYMELQITRRCNLKCRHCYIGPSENVELSPEDVRKVLDEFEALQGLRVIITGGEPLIHRDFSAINELLPGYALRKVLTTNGTLLTEKVLENLNVEEVQVSVDGLEEAHDALRGPGTFERTMRGMGNAINAGFDVSVSTMVHPRNLGDFDELEENLRALGVKDWTVDIPCAEGNLKDNPSFSLSPEDAGRYLGYGWGDGLHGGGEGHACGLHLVSVMADGGCARCAFYSENPSGNISEGLSECWRKIRPIRLDELKCDCNVLDSCRGGCRYRAEFFGDPYGKDLYRCVFFGKI